MNHNHGNMAFMTSCIRYHINSNSTDEKLKKHNLKEFRQFVRFCQKKSRYYKQLIEKESIRIEDCHPEDFPLLTKTEVMKNFNEIVTDPRITRKKVEFFLKQSSNPYHLYDNLYYVIHTSGSSGEEGIFVFSREDWAKSLAQNIKSPIVDMKKIRKRIAFYGAAQGHYTGVTFVTSMQDYFFKDFYPSMILDMNLPRDMVVSRLNAFRPDILVSYPSFMLGLAQEALNGQLSIDPYLIQLSGEPIRSEDYEYMQSAFPKAEILNFYSSTEHLLMGYGDKASSGMVLFEDRLIFEIHKTYVAVTNLFNHTMPLIRYRMDDVLIPRKDDSGQEAYDHIESIIGRKENSPQFKNRYGDLSRLSFINIGTIHISGLKRYQMGVIDEENFIFRILPEEGMSEFDSKALVEETRKTMQEILEKNDMGNVHFRVEITKIQVADPVSGKFKLICHQLSDCP